MPKGAPFLFKATGYIEKYTSILCECLSACICIFYRNGVRCSSPLFIFLAFHQLQAFGPGYVKRATLTKLSDFDVFPGAPTCPVPQEKHEGIYYLLDKAVFFCYPYGNKNTGIREMTSRTAYQLTTTAQRGRHPEGDIPGLRSVTVRRNDIWLHMSGNLFQDKSKIVFIRKR